MADDDSDWAFGADEVGESERANGDDERERDDGDADDDGEWRFSLSDLEDDQSAVEGNVFGSPTSDTEVIEAGSPDLENVLFLVVGVLVALAFFLQFYLAGAGPG
ncbi:DUF7312 domain-containing protein [Halapricum hydrolyticum]|uniref:DUF7312 domain-containing protein n=1 Tax=Halapricum hydrolyticum TaxID=2979991 RepID=A0AAE3LK73_9EURY|nr:hypothetical protein [Halapricum hydrolyticum]MCU4719477.1 hypothetical protein [Halapricum hydrolyticum]MCU4728088.1 hypothetical protein [Halapricum hydrolyticum]